MRIVELKMIIGIVELKMTVDILAVSLVEVHFGNMILLKVDPSFKVLTKYFPDSVRIWTTFASSRFSNLPVLELEVVDCNWDNIVEKIRFRKCYYT